MFCGFLSQEILKSFAADKIIETSELHVRTKRVIDETEDGKTTFLLKDYPFVVSIKRVGIIDCGGSILSHHFIITAAHCLKYNHWWYQVVSGSSNYGEGIHHKVEKKILHEGFTDGLFEDDIALAKISPDIVLDGLPNKAIELHPGPISPGTEGTIVSWGCCKVHENGQQEFPEKLKVITVPIISQNSCIRFFKGAYEITSKEICTRHPTGKKYCSNGDSGFPLVVNEKLLGINVWLGNKKRPTQHVYPDISMNLIEYTSWIEDAKKKLLEDQPIQYYPNNPNDLLYNPYNLSNSHNPSSSRKHPH